MKEKILNRTFAPGSKLPCERELCDQYGVKRVTIRNALDLLVQENLITKRMGLGSFVMASDEDAPENMPDSAATILFIMRRNANDIYSNTSSCNTRMFFEMERVCRRNGYLLSYIALEEGVSMMDIAKEHPFSGVFLVSSYLDSAIQDLECMKIPAVLLNHCDARLLSVMADNQAMLKLVISHLTEMKHTRIAYVDGMPDSRNAQERWEAFRFAMYEHHLQVDPSLYFVGNWTYDGGRQAARRLLETRTLPTAVFAASDMMAAGVMEELRSAGLKIPEDISIVGYDNLDIDVMLSPPLSSATIDFRDMCEVAFEHLKTIIKKGNRDMDHYIIRMPASLIRRGSVAMCENPLKDD